MTNDTNRLVVAVSLMALVLAVSGTLILTDEGSEAVSDHPSAGLCTVQFVPNYDGHTIGTSGAESVQVVNGRSIQLPTQMFAHSDSNTYLESWRLGSINGEDWEPGAEYTVTGDTVFYGHWVSVVGEKVHDDIVLTVGDRMDWSFIIPALSTTGDLTFDDVEKPEWLTVTPNLGIGIGKSNIQFSGNPPSGGVWCIHFRITEMLVVDHDYYFFIIVQSDLDKVIEFVYDSNGGTDIPEESNFELRAGTATILLKQGSTYKAGQDLYGWIINDGAGGNLPTYALGSAYTAGYDLYDLEMPIKLTADWRPKANVIILNASGAEGVNAFVGYEGDTISFPDKSQIDLKKPGYTLAGWYVGDSKEAVYGPSYIYRIGSAANGSITINAYWIAEGTETHSVTFDSNGGNDYHMTVSVEDGIGVVTPMYGCEKEGSTLVGWYTSPECEDPEDLIMPGQVFVPTQDEILYAQYVESSSEPDHLYTVVFDSYPGIGTFEAQEVWEGQTATEPATEPERYGYLFWGWVQAGPDLLWDFNRPILSDLTLKAQWKQHFTVSFDAEGKATVQILSDISKLGISSIDWGDGSVDEGVTSSKTHTYEGDVDSRIIVTTVVRTSNEALTSAMPFTVSDGKGETPDTTEPVAPEAVGSIIDNGDGTYTLDSHDSVGDITKVFWTLDGKRVSSDRTYTVTLDPGHHEIKLTVVSSDNLSDTWDGSVDVPERTNWMLIALIIVVIALIIIFVVRWF